MNAKTERRSQVLVDRELQLRLALRLTGTFLVGLLLFLGVSLALPGVFGVISGETEWTIGELRYRLEAIGQFVALPLGCAFLLMFAQGLRQTFRVAGPLVRFQSVFQRLSRLEVDRSVSIREDDYLQDAALALDEGLRRMHDELARARALGLQLRAELALLPAAPETEAVLRTADQLELQLSRFSLSNEGAADRSPTEGAAGSAGPA